MYCALVQWETYNQDIALIFAIVRSRKVTKYVSTSWVLNKGSIFYIRYYHLLSIRCNKVKMYLFTPATLHLGFNKKNAVIREVRLLM